MVIVIDGPEKVGKSTLVSQLVESLAGRGLRSKVRKWGRVFPDDRVYLSPLSDDAADTGTVTIWDRSWASEHVYGQLLGRDRRLSNDPWLGEWLYGRAVSSLGISVMLEAPTSQLRMRRDETDLPVDPTEEMSAFLTYASTFGWQVLSTQYSRSGLESTASLIIDSVTTADSPPATPPAYAGVRSPRVVFVGEVRSNHPQLVGAWLPFTSRYTTEFARGLGPQAMQCGWTNAHEIAPQRLRGIPVIVSCGEAARKWVQSYVVTDYQSVHINLPHPSWTYRYGIERTAESRSLTKSVLSALAKFISHQDGLEYVKSYAEYRRVLVSNHSSL